MNILNINMPLFYIPMGDGHSLLIDWEYLCCLFIVVICLNISSIFVGRLLIYFNIVKRADIEAKDKYGNTALMRASFWGHKEVVKILLENGADIEAKDESGITVLMQASLQGHEEVVKILLKKGADIEAKDKYGNTTLMLASGWDHEEVVKILLEEEKRQLLQGAYKVR